MILCYRSVIAALFLIVTSCAGPKIISSGEPLLAAASNPDTWWQPKADQKLTWYWQLQDPLNTSYDVDVYDIDIDTPQADINLLKSRGIKLICYFSVGTVEHFRSDANQFPVQVIGESYPGFPDEQFLDLGRYQLFANIMRQRLDKCAAKGFDGVEGDNVDAFLQQIPDANGVVSTGTSFQISQQQSVDYIRWLARESHQRGLAFGLKNAVAVSADVINEVDWLLTESCYVYSWCSEAEIFVRHNKPVFMTEYVEYQSDFSAACSAARKLGYSAIYRDTGLTASGIFQACSQTN